MNHNGLFPSKIPFGTAIDRQQERMAFQPGKSVAPEALPEPSMRIGPGTGKSRFPAHDPERVFRSTEKFLFRFIRP